MRGILSRAAGAARSAAITAIIAGTISVIILSIRLIARVPFDLEIPIWAMLLAAFIGPTLIFGMLFLGLASLSADVLTVHSRPNQGTRNSARMGLLCMLTALAAFFALALWLQSPRTDSTQPNYALLGSLLASVRIAPYFGMVGGGLFAVRHYVLRISLRLGRYAPLKYVRFLNSAADRLLLRKVGGGYIFTHRMLMEYFSALSKKTASER